MQEAGALACRDAPISVTATPAAALQRGTRRLGGRHGADDLVVVAAGERGLEQRRIGGERGRAASDSGTRATSISAATPDAGKFGEIAGEAVGHIHRRRGMGAHRFGQRIARLRQADSAA